MSDIGRLHAIAPNSFAPGTGASIVQYWTGNDVDDSPAPVIQMEGRS